MVQMVPGTPRRKGIKSSINIIKTKPPPKTVAFFFAFFQTEKTEGTDPYFLFFHARRMFYY